MVWKRAPARDKPLAVGTIGKGVLLGALVGFVGLPVLLIGFYFAKIPFQNRDYASQVFAELPYDSVLASRRWHPLRDGGGGWDCTFAVVHLPEVAPLVPPVLPASRQWYLKWGPRDWVATPGWAPCDNCRDAVAMCSGDLDADTAARLARALSEPGSWAQSDGAGETVSIYSAPERIAARIR